jgi:hypothetical protein
MSTATEAYRYSRLHIPVFDVDVPTVAIGRGVYFPLRAFCQMLGIAPQKQIDRMREDGRFHDGLRTVPIPTIKGTREAVCLNKRHLSMWLSLVDTSRCALSARGPIEDFQRRLFDAADRWLFGDTSDVVYDAGAKSDKPVTGTLHLGDCPRCGLPLCLVMDVDGNHLAPDKEVYY